MADAKLSSAARAVQGAIQQLDGVPGADLFRRELTRSLRYVPADALELDQPPRPRRRAQGDDLDQDDPNERG